MFIGDIWIPTSGDDTLDWIEYFQWLTFQSEPLDVQPWSDTGVIIVLCSVLALGIIIIITLFCVVCRKGRKLRLQSRGFALQREPAVENASRSDEGRKLYWRTKVLAKLASKAKPESTEPPAYDGLVEPPRPAVTAEGRRFVGYMV